MYYIAYIKRGKLRKKVLDLTQEPKTATEIAKSLNKHRSSISRILIELEKKGFIKCRNPKDVMYRIYSITEKGKKFTN